MLYRRFGKTGLQMPLLTAGMMRAKYSWQQGDIGLVPPDNQDNLQAVVERALELGINHIETARGYGTSERQLQRVLCKIPRNDFLLQTKVAPSHDPDQFTAEVLDSLSRLGVERVDLLAIHGLNDYEALWRVCRKNGCLAAARRLRDQGKVGWIGFSGHGPTDVLLQAVRFSDYEGFDYLNLHWYTVFQLHEPVLAAARERDMGVLIISPSDKGGMLHTPPPKLLEMCAPLTPMQFNDLFCLQRPEINTLSIGAARPADYNQHVQAVAASATSTDVTREIYARWTEAMTAATGHARPDALWNKFKPWRATPGYINVPFILWLYNLARGWDLTEFAQTRYRQLGRDVRWVPGNKAALVANYDWRAVAEPAGLQTDELVDLLREAHELLG